MSNLCPLIYTGFVPKDLVVENATVTKVLVACDRSVEAAAESTRRLYRCEIYEQHIYGRIATGANDL